MSKAKVMKAWAVFDSGGSLTTIVNGRLPIYRDRNDALVHGWRACSIIPVEIRPVKRRKRR